MSDRAFKMPESHGTNQPKQQQAAFTPGDYLYLYTLFVQFDPKWITNDEMIIHNHQCTF